MKFLWLLVKKSKICIVACWIYQIILLTLYTFKFQVVCRLHFDIYFTFIYHVHLIYTGFIFICHIYWENELFWRLAYSVYWYNITFLKVLWWQSFILQFLFLSLKMSDYKWFHINKMMFVALCTASWRTTYWLKRKLPQNFPYSAWDIQHFRNMESFD